MKKQTTYSFKTLGGGGRNALVAWVLAVCTKSYRHPELYKTNQRALASCVSLYPSAKPLGVSGSLNKLINNIKLERLLTRIRSCTTLFCYVKNKFQGKSPPLLGRI